MVPLSPLAVCFTVLLPVEISTFKGINVNYTRLKSQTQARRVQTELLFGTLIKSWTLKVSAYGIDLYKMLIQVLFTV